MKTIKTPRYILTKLEMNDTENVFEILNNEAVIENLNMKLHKNVQDTHNLLKEYMEGLKEKTKFPYKIIDKKTNDFIGVFLIKLDLYDEDCFEFTIYLNEKHWGKGVYTEVLPYMTKTAFEDVKTGNFRGFVKEKNIASRHVLEKCGFKLEKIFNVPEIDEKIYSFLINKDEYFKKKL